MGDDRNLRKQLKIKFDGEEGVDQGGVGKEFFQLLVQELFNPDYGMFEYFEDVRFCWPNKNSLENNRLFELIGVLLGMAMYNGIILDVHFPRAVYKKLLNYKPTLSDLREFQPAIAKSLNDILSMPPDRLAECNLHFSVEVERFGELITVPLGDHSNDETVIETNRAEYVELYLDWYLNKSIENPFKSFYVGFHRCFEKRLLQLFHPEELQLVICGSPELNFDALEKATNYQDGFTSQSETIVHFWEVVHSMDNSEKKKLLSFITGSDRVPVGGLSTLGLVIGRNGPDCDRLPTAATCFNILLLPDYKNKSKLERFLKVAIQYCQGFGLQ